MRNGGQRAVSHCFAKSIASFGPIDRALGKVGPGVPFAMTHANFGKIPIWNGQMVLTHQCPPLCAELDCLQCFLVLVQEVIGEGQKSLGLGDVKA